jgi:hypothetical protein
MDLATSIPVTPSWYSLTAPSGKVILIIFFGWELLATSYLLLAVSPGLQI